MTDGKFNDPWVKRMLKVCAIVGIIIAFAAGSQVSRPGRQFGGPIFVDRRSPFGWYCTFLMLSVPVHIAGWVAAEKLDVDARQRSGLSPDVLATIFLYYNLFTPLMPISIWILYTTRKTKGGKGDILLFLLSWSASRSQRRLKTEYCSRFRLPVSITKRSAASKAVSQGLEFGFCFHPIDMASPLSGLQGRSVAKQSIRATTNRVLIGLNRKRLESPLPDMPAAFAVPMVTANVRRHEPLHLAPIQGMVNKPTS